MELDLVKRENERLRRQQEDTFGVTADSVDRMKKELERAKTTRMFLLEDIEVRKGKSEKMEADIFELNMKLESFNKKLNEYNQMRDEWMNTSEKLQKTEEKCEKLTKVNKNLRLLLLKHHIDPKSVDFDNGRSKKSAASDKGPVRSILKPSGLKRKPDAHTQSHNNTITGHPPRGTRSLGDNRQDPAEVVDEEVKRRTSFTSRKALGRGPPSYLGYYTDIHHSRVMGKAKVDTVHLPKLVVA
ncbi:hypothetical protein DPMN_025657 [Dreissena polymorpha]|uniref:Uncharacterized protein n=1 Tax=Dreissena polymorpha TaxID=45954 RepID=A0A9D4LRV6_DREPO|nr:hypothetical protein DPMN_025657 [Dreissena polymorpha]